MAASAARRGMDGARMAAAAPAATKVPTPAPISPRIRLLAPGSSASPATIAVRPITVLLSASGLLICVVLSQRKTCRISGSGNRNGYRKREISWGEGGTDERLVYFG